MARGPAYPYTDLGGAIELLRKLYAYAKRSPANVEAAAKDAWNWSPTSSTASKAVAALKYFGLAEDAGKDHKSIKITDRGFRILVDHEDSEERKKALREAALSPTQYAYAHNSWGAELPASARSTLMIERGFVPSTVDGFMRDYKRTMDFAGLNGDEMEDESEAPDSLSPSDSVVKMPNQSTPATDVPVRSAQASAFGQVRDAREGRAMRQEVFSVEEGAIRVEWPASLSQASLEDIEAWLPILARKIKRAAKEEEAEESPN